MVFTSPYPDVDIPEVSISEYLFAEVASRADRAALIDGTSGQEITYGQLAHLTDRVAAALAERGIGRDDVVAIFAPNTSYWAVVCVYIFDRLPLLLTQMLHVSTVSSSEDEM